MFEGGSPGGNFLTFVGTRTGDYYRLDIQKFYTKDQLDELLAPAVEREGKLLKLPDELRCKMCGNLFLPTWIPIDGEEIVEAYEL